jgi:glyoxylase I family protein
MRGRMHHLDLTVSDPAASRPFYELFLGHMGYVVGKVHDDGYVEFDLPSDGFMSVGMLPSSGANAKRAPDRYSPGLHHAAWISPTREDVDALYAKLVAAGAAILDAPADYPRYNKGRGYYAVFFADPDGLKLEYVWTPPPAENDD